MVLLPEVQMVLLPEVQTVALYGCADRKSVPEVFRRIESVVTMPILIKDMEMPKNCYSCDFGAFYSDGQMYCKRQMRGVMTGLKRPDWCPLVEIKRPNYDAALLRDCGMEE